MLLDDWFLSLSFIGLKRVIGVFEMGMMMMEVAMGSDGRGGLVVGEDMKICCRYE